jgi:hypothetical protein
MDYGSVYLGYVGWLVFLLVAAKLYLRRLGRQRSWKRNADYKGNSSLVIVGSTGISETKFYDNASIRSHGSDDESSKVSLKSELSNIDIGFTNSVTFNESDRRRLQVELETCLEKADNAAKDLEQSLRSGSARGSGSTLEMVFGTKRADANFADNYYSSDSDHGSDYVKSSSLENKRSSFREELGMKLAKSVSADINDPYAPADNPLDDLDVKIAYKIAMSGGGEGQSKRNSRSKTSKKMQAPEAVNDYLL